MISETDVDVARAILRHGPIARSEIARMTGLTSGAVTKVTRKLIERGLIEESEPQAREQGRPVVPLSVVGDAGRCLGIKIVPGAAHLAVTGLTGQVHDLATVAIDTSSPDAVVDSLLNTVANGNYAAVGVALPAAVGADGSLHAARMLGWSAPVNLRRRFCQAVGLPCSVANDVHALTQRAHWFGALRGFRHSVLITFGQGVGVGAVVDDELLIGHQGAASILGRLWTPHGQLFGDLLSVEALEARVARTSRKHVPFPELLDEPAAGEALDFTARTLGELVRAASIAYTPERVLLTGEAIGVLDGRMELVEEALRVEWRDDLDVPELVVEPLEISDFAVGAAGLAVSALFLSNLGVLSASGTRVS